MAAKVPHTAALRYLGLFAVLLLGIAAFIKFRDSEDCVTRINDGEWSGGHWHARTCFLHYFHASEVKRCLSNFSDIILVGDSTHVMFTSMTSLDAGSEHIKEIVGAKYIDDNTFDKYSKIAKSLSGKAALVVDQPTQLFTPDAKDIVHSCAGNIDLLIASQRELLKTAPFSKIVTLAPNGVSDAAEEVLKCSRLAEEKYSKLSPNSSIVYLAALAVPTLERGTEKHKTGYLSEDLNLVLNLYCNTPCNATCCVHLARGRFHGMSTLLVVLAVYAGLWMVWLTGATEPIIVYLEGCSIDTAKLRKAFNYIGVLVLCAFYYTAAERLQLFEVTNKSSSPLLFCLWLVGSLAAGISTCARGPQKFLSSEQSNTLIGWMGLVVVGLHYTAMDKELSLYLLGDLLLGGIVLLFSYRQFMYFWECGSFNYTRVVMVLIRINLLPLILGVLLGVSYLTYILPLLLSLGFLTVYISMVTNVQISKVQIQAQKKHIIFTTAKLLLLFLAISFIFSLKFMFSVRNDSMKWLDTLNHHKHMPLYGIALGYITSVLRIYHTSVTKYGRILKVAGFIISLAIIMCYSIWIVICKDPLTCTQWQSYFSVLPIFAGIFVCNSLDSLQTLYSRLMLRWGSAYIVLYCSHLHILCSFNGRGLLALFPHVPALNTVIVVGVYFLVIHQVIRAEDALVDVLRPSPLRQVGSSFPTKGNPDGTEAPQLV